jgi:hypothetical protein
MKLKLGPLPKTETVKVTVQLSSELKTKLDQYAYLHSETFGQRVEAAALIPLMLQTFMDRDRGFKSMQKRQLRGSEGAGREKSFEGSRNSDELADRSRRDPSLPQ